MRGIYTSEFWVGAAGIVLMVLIMMDGRGRGGSELAIPAIAKIASVYIGGRCFVKAVEAFCNRRRSPVGSKEGEETAYHNWRA